MVLKLFILIALASTLALAADDKEADSCKKKRLAIADEAGVDPFDDLARLLPYPEDRIPLGEQPKAPPPPRESGWQFFKETMVAPPHQLSVDEVQKWLSAAQIAGDGKVWDLEFAALYKSMLGDTVTHDFDQGLTEYLKANGAAPEKLHLFSTIGSEGDIYTHPDLPGKAFKVTKGGGKGDESAAITMAYQLMQLRMAVQKASISAYDFAKVEHIGKGFFVREFEQDSLVRPGRAKIKTICESQGVDFDAATEKARKEIAEHPGLGIIIAANMGANQNFISKAELKRSKAAGRPRIFVIYDIN